MTRQGDTRSIGADGGTVPDGAQGGPAPPAPEGMSAGEPVEVAPGVVRLLAPNPGRMTGPGTNTYLVGAGRLALVDPGPDDDVHLGRILELYGDRIGWIVVTHSHIDHSPLSRRLSAATGAPVVGFGPPPAPAGPGPTGIDPHDAGFAPGVLLADGERLHLGDAALEAVWTPGHASNHLCLELAGTGLLFSGDHVMSGSTVVIAPPDGDMAIYLESLEKVRRRRPRRIAPGHGGMIEDPGSVLDGYLRHRVERELQVAQTLASAGPDGLTAEAIVEVLYRDVPKELHPVARYTVWAHLRKLQSDSRADSPDRDDVDAPWTSRPGPDQPKLRKMRKA
ncbi:MAG TPA: MBL fold metallo-hydrolase [Acidimicrobiales bacterium]|nr:MBL fold metallo-hydrolase [Acidimicrobiales bacterium]